MFVGIDIGGTNTRIVTNESLEEISFRDFLSLETSKDFEAGLQRIVETIKGFDNNVEAIGIGLPGSISQDGVLDGSTNLSGWVGKPLKQELEKIFGCPVFVKNDAEIGALGEAYFGQIDKEDFFYITWGTGVGCAQIVWENGKATVSRPKNRQPIYDLESKIGGNDIKQRFNKSADKLDESGWSAVMNDLINDISGIVKDYGFKTVVVGGGVAVHQVERVSKAAEKISDVRIVVTNLKGKAGLYGALAVLKK